MKTGTSQKRIFLALSILILAGGVLFVTPLLQKKSLETQLLHQIETRDFSSASSTLQNLLAASSASAEVTQYKTLQIILGSLDSFSKMKLATNLPAPLQTLQFLRAIRSQLAVNRDTVAQWAQQNEKWKGLENLMAQMIHEMNDFETQKLTPGHLEEMKRHRESAQLQKIILDAPKDTKNQPKK